MPQTLETTSTNGNGDQIKVGITGTVSSLMSRELETVKQSCSAAQASSSSRKKLQDPPVSVPCGYSPRRTQPTKSTTNDPSSSSSSNSGSRSPAGTQKSKPKPRRNKHRSPMLAPAEPTLEKNTSTEKLEKKKKKGHTHIVEVVDLKCNNPMSSRLKKLGFSKLSESTA